MLSEEFLNRTAVPMYPPDINPADQVVHFLIEQFDKGEKNEKGELEIPFLRRRHGRSSMQVALDPGMEGFLVSNPPPAAALCALGEARGIGRKPDPRFSRPHR